ncbi:hypothetical protein FRC11_002262, partial [Ceratobasidium sp. 423]
DHPWLVADRNREVDMAGWVVKAVEYRKAKRAAGAEVSSSDARVPDKQTVEAAVKAGDVVTKGKPAVDGKTPALPAETPAPPVENGAPDIDSKPTP